MEQMGLSLVLFVICCKYICIKFIVNKNFYVFARFKAYCTRINGGILPIELILTKVDAFNELENFHICTRYETNGRIINQIPYFV